MVRLVSCAHAGRDAPGSANCFVRRPPRRYARIRLGGSVDFPSNRRFEFGCALAWMGLFHWRPFAAPLSTRSAQTAHSAQVVQAGLSDASAPCIAAGGVLRCMASPAIASKSAAVRAVLHIRPRNGRSDWAIGTSSRTTFDRTDHGPTGASPRWFLLDAFGGFGYIAWRGRVARGCHVPREGSAAASRLSTAGCASQEAALVVRSCLGGATPLRRGGLGSGVHSLSH